MRWGPAAIVVGLVLSFSSSAVATVVFTRGIDSTKSRILVMNDDGSGAHKLTKGYFPRLSPDLQNVAFLRLSKPAYTSDLYVIPLAGGTPRLLARDVDPLTVAWSPDLKHIATVTDNFKKLVVLEVASGAETKIASGTIQGVSFSPAGDQLVYGRSKTNDYLAAGDVYRANTAGGTSTRLTNNGRSANPVWGPEKIAFNRFKKRKNDAPIYQIWLMNSDGSGQAQLTKIKVGTLVSGLVPVAWSANGQAIVANYNGQDTQQAYAVNPLTGSTRDLGQSKFDGTIAYGVSCDGSNVLVQTGGYEAMASSKVGTVPFTGGSLTVLANNALTPDRVDVCATT